MNTCVDERSMSTAFAAVRYYHFMTFIAHLPLSAQVRKIGENKLRHQSISIAPQTCALLARHFLPIAPQLSTHSTTGVLVYTMFTVTFTTAM